MFVTAAQRVARARQLFGLSTQTPIVMTSPSGGFIQDQVRNAATGSTQVRSRIAAHLGLDMSDLIVSGPCAVAADSSRVLFIPLNGSNTDFADPVEIPRDDLWLRWWDAGGRSNSYCRMWFTAGDRRWALLDVPRRALFMRSKFAVGLDELIAAVPGEHMDPAPDLEA